MQYSTCGETRLTIKSNMQDQLITKRTRPWLKLFLLGLVIVFLVVNLLLYFIYRDQTYPNARVAGKELGSVKYEDLPKRLELLDLLPGNLTLEYESKQAATQASSLGLSLDSSALQRSIKQVHRLPIMNLISRRDTPLVLRIDDTALDKQLAALNEKIKQPSADAKLVKQYGTFVLINAEDEKSLNLAESRRSLISAVSLGQQSLPMVIDRNPPKVVDGDLAPTFKKLQDQQSTKIGYAHADKKITLEPADINEWFSLVNGQYVLSDATIRSYINMLSQHYKIGIKNLPEAVAASKQAVEQTRPLEYAFEPLPYRAPRKTFNYCTATKGVDAILMPGLKRKLANTYADERGWTSGGAIDFVWSDGNCDFTVWLSAADQMTSFGAICDHQWNCSVGNNVVINFDRWQSASDSWNASGGSPEDYRSMAINHETGHWLGFGHKICGGQGQAAPVMQQQSIDLHGCKFNPWPLAQEQAELKAKQKL
jgi:hypothetical protein